MHMTQITRIRIAKIVDRNNQNEGRFNKNPNENREFDEQKEMKIWLKNAKRCVNIMFIFSI